MPIKIAINGCGRIGRNVIRQLHNFPEIELVAINDLTDIEVIAHLLKYDSIHGKKEISCNENTITINNRPVHYYKEKDPSQLPWKDLEIEVVIDSTGFFKTAKDLSKHLQAGAQKVILSAPSDDPQIPMLVLGVNDQKVLASHPKIVSNSSCTTYSSAPVIDCIDRLAGIRSAYISTVHAYTSDQNLHDSPHKDLRRARAAALSIIPTTTGASKVMDSIFPHLQGKIGGVGIRVPVPTGSLSDMAFVLEQDCTVTEVNSYLQKAAQNELKGILEYNTDPLVSADIIGNTHASIVDAALTQKNGSLLKVVAWYDNETGYSTRLLDLVLKMQ